MEMEEPIPRLDDLSNEFVRFLKAREERQERETMPVTTAVSDHLRRMAIFEEAWKRTGTCGWCRHPLIHHNRVKLLEHAAHAARDRRHVQPPKR